MRLIKFSSNKNRFKEDDMNVGIEITKSIIDIAT